LASLEGSKSPSLMFSFFLPILPVQGFGFVSFARVDILVSSFP
jgi:hypothetical protein